MAKRTITMTDRRPLKIDDDAWPLVAKGEGYSGQYDFQAFDGAWVRVRQHQDGRSIVYGYAGDWDGGGRPTRENIRAGYLLDAGQDIAAAINRVVSHLEGCDVAGQYAAEAGRQCLADLPAEELA